MAKYSFEFKKKVVQEYLDGKGGYFNTTIDGLDDGKYQTYSKEKFPSRLGENKGTLYTYSNYPGYDAETQTMKNYMNFGVNGNSRNGSTEEQNDGYKGYTKSCYNKNGGFAGGTAGVWYGDSCLLVGYKMEIDKSVTQTTVNLGKEKPKDTYSLDDGQRWADFKLVGSSVASTKNLSDSTVSTLKTTVYIEDTLPKGLSYVEGSSYYGGTYRQTEEGRKGIVDDGIPITPTVTPNSDGTTTLLYTIPDVMLDMNERTTLPPIYYSCKIGDSENFLNDVQNGQHLENIAKIWSTETVGRAFNAEEGNMTSEDIQISKLNLGNISKLADDLYVDVGESMGFTMAIGNSGATARNICALDILPYNGGNGTEFAESGCLSEVTELTLEKNTSGVNLDNLDVYYSMDIGIRDKTGKEYQNMTDDDLLSDGWVKMELDTTNGIVTIPKTFRPVAILVKGYLDGGQMLGMHLTMNLTDGTLGDNVVNRLYESGGIKGEEKALAAQADTRLISRTLEGLTWRDFNMDGIQNDGKANNISGIKVTLLKLKDGGNSTDEKDYEIYHYGNNPANPEVIIETGQEVNVRIGSPSTVTDCEQGRYRFMELPAGIFAVRFEDGNGNVKISEMFASPENVGDDTMDSDGIPTYNNDKKDVLQYTVITGIEMYEKDKMSEYQYVSTNHDSGFYPKGHELPETGGIGTKPYIIGGVLLITLAGILLYIKIKCRKGDIAST